jgi:hypothetical protein
VTLNVESIGWVRKTSISITYRHLDRKKDTSASYYTSVRSPAISTDTTCTALTALTARACVFRVVPTVNSDVSLNNSKRLDVVGETYMFPARNKINMYLLHTI